MDWYIAKGNKAMAAVTRPRENMRLELPNMPCNLRAILLRSAVKRTAMNREIPPTVVSEMIHTPAHSSIHNCNSHINLHVLFL